METLVLCGVFVAGTLTGHFVASLIFAYRARAAYPPAPGHAHSLVEKLSKPFTTSKKHRPRVNNDQKAWEIQNLRD